MDCETLDFDTAFLEALVLKGTVVYVEQPHGLREPGDRRVCLLHKALYGLKEAPLWWFLYITKHIRALGFVPVDREPCIMRRGGVLVMIYVDNCAIACLKGTGEIAVVREQLREACGLKNIGPLANYLGFEIIRDRPNRTLYLH
ncbi:hypothetical protein IMZ48_33160 [Candidatus Bathyarchaeota archaeon]|nr:hypothetical protein [Candidatus Bathyarchaeota archaeon]